MSKQIESEKLLVKDVFQRFYRIPEYQRPYVWGSDQVTELLDDVYASSQSNRQENQSQYFIGSLVLHKKEKLENGIKFIEYDLLDGQQRLTTLLLLTAVVRDLTPASHEARIKSCKESIYRMAVPDDNIPERLRIVFDIRKEVSEFVESYIKTDGGTNKIEDLIKLAGENGNKNNNENEIDISIRNMAKAIMTIRDYFSSNDRLDAVFPYLRSNVVMIYVAADELDDAFRLFTIMNNRGVKLRSSDILKADNLALVRDENKRKEYAKEWEEIENYFSDDFDNFLSQIRTVLVKTKANLTLLKEFEENIYNPKSFDRSTKIFTPLRPLINKGEETFKFIKKYYDNYIELFDKDNYSYNNSFKYKNLLTVMEKGLEADYWVAPILKYYDKFKEEKIIEFLELLDNKFSADWINGLSPTVRIENINSIIKKIDLSSNTTDVLNSNELTFNSNDFIRILSGDIYSKRFARYVLLKLDYLYLSETSKLSLPDIISIEHILPQNPSADSQWIDDFTNDERAKLTNKLGNLVLISKKKNSSQGNKDYSKKKDNYFKNRVEVFSNSVRVLSNNNEWKPDNLIKHHIEVMKKLFGSYGIQRTEEELKSLLNL